MGGVLLSLYEAAKPQPSAVNSKFCAHGSRMFFVYPLGLASGGGFWELDNGRLICIQCQYWE